MCIILCCEHLYHSSDANRYIRTLHGVVRYAHSAHILKVSTLPKRKRKIIQYHLFILIFLSFFRSFALFAGWRHTSVCAWPRRIRVFALIFQLLLLPLLLLHLLRRPCFCLFENKTREEEKREENGNEENVFYAVCFSGSRSCFSKFSRFGKISQTHDLYFTLLSFRFFILSFRVYYEFRSWSRSIQAILMEATWQIFRPTRGAVVVVVARGTDSFEGCKNKLQDRLGNCGSVHCSPVRVSPSFWTMCAVSQLDWSQTFKIHVNREMKSFSSNVMIHLLHYINRVGTQLTLWHRGEEVDLDYVIRASYSDCTWMGAPYRRKAVRSWTHIVEFVISRHQRNSKSRHFIEFSIKIFLRADYSVWCALWGTDVSEWAEYKYTFYI